VPARSQLNARPEIGQRFNQATLLEVVRCAITLPLPHLRQRKRLTN
jgi:hypothetical protein